MAMPGNRDAVVCNRLIAVDDQVGADVVPGTRHLIALASDESPVEAHRCRSADDFASVIGIVAEADKVDHGWFSCEVGGTARSLRLLSQQSECRHGEFVCGAADIGSNRHNLSISE